MKMKLFSATLRDRAKYWLLKLRKEFTGWTEMEEEFLRNYYSGGKTTSLRKAIREFTQGSSETFHEAWERLRDLTRECPHHGLNERIDKMVKVHNLLLDRLNIHNGFEGLAPVSLQEASPCTTCSRLNHVELDCLVMAIQGQGMYRQGPSAGPSQQGRPNYPGNCPNQYNTHIFKNSLQNNGYKRNNDQPYPPQYNGQQSYPNQRQSSFVPPTQPQAYT